MKETSRLLALLLSIENLEPTHRKVVAEIIHLRLSILVENHLKRAFCKICCGALFIDGSQPALVAQQRSMQSAEMAMKTLNRTRNLSLKWNDGPSIRKNVEHIVDNTDHSITTMLNYGSFLTQMRYIRNHIAHRNDGSRANFRTVVRQVYGAYVPNIDCGTLLLSNRNNPPIIEVHLRTSRVMIKDLMKS